VNKSKGFDHIRLSLSTCDLEDETQIKSLLAMIDRFKGADMWASIPCGPWSPWCLWKEVSTHFQHQKTEAHFFVVAERIIANGGHVSFEARTGVFPEKA